MFRTSKTLMPAAVAAMVLLTAACGEHAPDRPNNFPAGSTMSALASAPKIKVGASPNQPGLAELNLQHDWEGFNTDLAVLLVESLGIDRDDIEWVHTTAANRIPFLKQGKIDFFATALAITPEREKTLAIAGPYLETAPSLMVRKDDAMRFETLHDIPEGAKVCVLQGSQGQPRVSEFIPQAEISEFNTLTNCVRALEQGTVDAIDSTAPLLAGFVADKPDSFALAPVTYGTGERWGIGIADDRSDLCEFFNQRLAQAFDDGTIRELWDRHMGDSGLEAPTVPDEMASC
ncbi:amino acid ABC transporter substrate-binding protein (PAAT family) [Rhodococcus wratislaviensis]|uniref:Glutamate-binding protein n=2 Tax=Rhodococcus TaxID=1827 RepID=A0AB38FPD5_RHOWR|nr:MULTISPECIES: transporter substrate-binding domain-containing protein [Rhodococcus]REE75699.1 amino acid ABC transporter substrate-binding protein (PAAT family) [Rhodococcus wratislaviensis]SPZ43401.1 glutamate-binding protein [Rhodococcus wratislaviensis]